MGQESDRVACPGSQRHTALRMILAGLWVDEVRKEVVISAVAKRES